MSATCKCGAQWSGKRIEHCDACHETFTGTSAGDKHRTGSYVPMERRCLSADEMRALGMEQNARGVWTLGGVSPWAGVAESDATGRPESAEQPTPRVTTPETSSERRREPLGWEGDQV